MRCAVLKYDLLWRMQELLSLQEQAAAMLQHCMASCQTGLAALQGQLLGLQPGAPALQGTGVVAPQVDDDLLQKVGVCVCLCLEV